MAREDARILVNRQGGTLLDELLKLMARAREARLASAFLSRDVLDEIVEAAEKSNCKLHFLTGTFGNQTRRAAYERLLQLGGNRVETRIWNCGQHRDFHAKLYMWRLDGEGVAWVGSANLTEGLWRDGELVLEVRGRWGAGLLGKLQAAFDGEWKRARPLDGSFVRTYREAKRVYPEVKGRRGPKRRASGKRRAGAAGQRVSSGVEKAFLFTWNPRGHPKIPDSKWRRLVKERDVSLKWSCGGRRDDRKIPEGSLAFLVKLGQGVPDRGIVAIARTRGEPYPDKDWRNSRRKVLYVDLEPEKGWENPIVALEELRKRWPDVNWTPQASGTEIPYGVAQRLWKLCVSRSGLR
ncbi:MAG: phospholipase D-like domain-containing protein [Armatimonadota bacterium]|nr:phospholipase D-like domain-containing protein [Armatimonadota bacterium]